MCGGHEITEVYNEREVGFGAAEGGRGEEESWRERKGEAARVGERGTGMVLTGL